MTKIRSISLSTLNYSSGSDKLGFVYVARVPADSELWGENAKPRSTEYPIMTITRLQRVHGLQAAFCVRNAKRDTL